MREVKRLQLMTVDKPRVDIECGGATISSAIIPNAQKNPNFPDNVRVMDVVSGHWLTGISVSLYVHGVEN